MLTAVVSGLLCGTLRPFARAVHLVSLVDHQTGCVLSQCRVDEKTNARDHWGAIENGLHYVLDEAFGEDRSTIFCGDAPQNLAALRNAGLNCLRHLKIDNVTAPLRRFARKPLRLLRILGYPN